MLFDDLFLQPFLTGLGLAVLLPLLGCYLRLRDEWLAALTYAQVAAAGALAAMAVAWPLVLGAALAAGLAAGVKHLASLRGLHGAAYALLLLGGWAAAVLLVSNLPAAESMGHALFDGQLYFTDWRHLVVSVAWTGLALAFLRLFSRRLLLARLYPDFFRARGLPNWPAQLGFDLLGAGSLALATMSLGVMGAFGLIFVPPWVAFSWASSWRRGLVGAVGLGVLAYGAAFAAALEFDQPFGPILALVLILAGLPPLFRRRHCA